MPRACPPLRAPFVAALALAALVPAARTGRAASAPTDTLVTYSTRLVELHAPTERDLFVVAKQLDYVSLQFERHVGERVPKIPVYVCASGPQASARVPTPGAPSSSRYLVWVGPTRRTPTAGKASAGAAPAPKSAAPAADPEPAFDHAYAHAVVDGWAQRGRAAAGTLSGGLPVIGLKPSDARLHATDPALPAWFQEAIAGLCEPVGAQNARVEAARAALARRIPFPELFAGPFPSDPARARIFLDESVALMRFIIEREDEPFLRQIAVALLAGKPTGEALVNAKVIYSKPEALEQQWVEWMQRAEPPPH